MSRTICRLIPTTEASRALLAVQALHRRAGAEIERTMTMHLLDLRLAEVLTEERLEAARRAHITTPRRQSLEGAAAWKSARRGGVVLRRPAHGTAGH